MTDKIEQANIRGLDVDKTVKGFALTNYIFKNLVTVSPTSGDSIRWYQEEATDLISESPAQIETDRLATFTTLDVDWTRNTSYPVKYGVTSMISREDIKSADIDVLARTILRLTRAVVKKVDTAIYDIMSDSGTPTNILEVGATGTGWDDTTNGNPVLDIMSGVAAIAENDYDMSNYIIAMNPKNHKDLMNYLITVKGSSIPAFSSEKVRTGQVMNLLGGSVIVSNNVTADSVWLGLPATAVTWKSFEDIHSETENVMGLGTRIAIWENGIPILTDPKAACLITDTDT